MQRQARRLMGVAAAASLVVAAGCGGDDDGASAAQTREYCDATEEIELTTAQGPDVDFESASPEQIAAASKEFATGVMRPIADRIVAAAPEGVADDITILNGAVTEVEQSGDFDTAFSKPEVEEASQNAHEFDLKNCGWDTVDVKAADYKYEDVPRNIDAGLVSFEMENDGKELHEMVIFRKNDGVTETFDQIFEAPDEGAMEEKATFVAATGGTPDEKGIYAVADLQPGQYAMVCFIPQGTLTEEALEAETEAPPHFTLGMKQEFTVEA
jgi:hypothetical protein